MEILQTLPNVCMMNMEMLLGFLQTFCLLIPDKPGRIYTVCLAQVSLFRRF